MDSRWALSSSSASSMSKLKNPAMAAPAVLNRSFMFPGAGGSGPLVLYEEQRVPDEVDRRGGEDPGSCGGVFSLLPWRSSSWPGSRASRAACKGGSSETSPCSRHHVHELIQPKYPFLPGL